MIPFSIKANELRLIVFESAVARIGDDDMSSSGVLIDRVWYRSDPSNDSDGIIWLPDLSKASFYAANWILYSANCLNVAFRF